MVPVGQQASSYSCQCEELDGSKGDPAVGAPAPQHLLDLALAGFFLFRSVKEALADITLDQESIKNAGKESLGPLPPRTISQPSGGGLSCAKSAWGLAVTL